MEYLHESDFFFLRETHEIYLFGKITAGKQVFLLHGNILNYFSPMLWVMKTLTIFRLTLILQL